MKRPLAIVPTYLAEPEDVELLDACLRSLRMSAMDWCDVLVVDDCSPQQRLKQQAADIAEAVGGEIDFQESNEGFARTVNVGLERALATGSDAILVNADVEFDYTSDWLPRMVNTQDETGRPAAIVGARLLYPDGRIQHAGVFFSMLVRTFGHIYQYGPGNLPEADQYRECPVTGALQFIRFDTLERIGVYDPSFRMGFEDVDYCVDPLTPVLTRDGWASAGSLVGREVEVATIDGEFRPATWYEARGGAQSLYEVECEDGQLLRATAEHRWPVRRLGRGGIEWVTTVELEERRLVIAAPRIDMPRSEIFAEGVRHGFTFGDGTVNTGRPSAKVVAYPSNPAKQAFVREWFEASEHSNGNVVGKGLPAEFKRLPEDVSDPRYLAGFVAGFIAADAGVSDGGPRLTCADHDAVEFVAGVLDDLGLRPGKVRHPPARETDFGVSRVATLKVAAELVRANPWLCLRPDHSPPNAKSQHRSLRVRRVTKLNLASKVVCCEEPETHTWVTAGGIVTGNCVRAWQAGLSCIYNPGVIATHHESVFRGRATKGSKLERWQSESWLRFATKWGSTNFASFVPSLSIT